MNLKLFKSLPAVVCLLTSVSVSAAVVSVDVVNFPADNFRNWLKVQSYGATEVLTIDTHPHLVVALYVMANSKSAYEYAPCWQDFFNIQKIINDAVGIINTYKQENNEIYTLWGSETQYDQTL